MQNHKKNENRKKNQINQYASVLGKRRRHGHLDLHDAPRLGGWRLAQHPLVPGFHAARPRSALFQQSRSRNHFLSAIATQVMYRIRPLSLSLSLCLSHSISLPLPYQSWRPEPHWSGRFFLPVHFQPGCLALLQLELVSYIILPSFDSRGFIIKRLVSFRCWELRCEYIFLFGTSFRFVLVVRFQLLR